MPLLRRTARAQPTTCACAIVLLDGTGRVLMDAFRLEEVDPARVAVTATPAESTVRRPALPEAPSNVDFEDAP